MILISHAKRTRLNIFEKKSLQIYNHGVALYNTTTSAPWGKPFVLPGPPIRISVCAGVFTFALRSCCAS